jgi:hypothetical protein
MAYIDFSEAGGATRGQGAVIVPRSFVKPAARASALSYLEWQVVTLARGDRLSSIYEAGPIARAARWLFGLTATNALSDPRLEALRRMSVLSWHRGYSVAEEEVRAFIAAGFTLEHYDIVLTHINAARAAFPRKIRP